MDEAVQYNLLKGIPKNPGLGYAAKKFMLLSVCHFHIPLGRKIEG